MVDLSDKKFSDDESFQQASKEDVDAVLAAVKELTKITGDLAKEWEKWRKAGKF